MENILFESQITFSKNAIKEYLKAWFLKSKIWLILLLPIIFIVAGIVIALADNGDVRVLGIGIFLELIILLLVFIRYHLDSKLIYARTCEQNNGQEITNTVQFFEDNIILINTLTGNKVNYTYSIVKRIINSKNLIMFITEAKAMIGVEKAKFTIGNANDLIRYMESKLKRKQ